MIHVKTVTGDVLTLSERVDVPDADALSRIEMLARIVGKDGSAAIECDDGRYVFGRHIVEVWDDPKPPTGQGVRLGSHTWAQLSDISRRIASASTDGEAMAVARSEGLVGEDGRLAGDTKEVLLRDGTVAHVRIVGFRHDELASGGGKAGITFEFADVPARHRMNPTHSNEGGWKGSKMRAWLNSDFLGLLPVHLCHHIAGVCKRTNNASEVGLDNTSCVTSTSDRLWLLSMSEVYGRLSDQKNVPWSPATYDAEGSQYQLYRDMGVSTTSYGPAKKDGADSWWLRSPGACDLWDFLSVRVDGDWDYDPADYELGVSPCFCI